MTSIRHRKLAAAVFVTLFAGAALAASSGASKNVQVELIPEVQWIQPGVPFSLGIHLKMAPHWHTYWKFPGDSGLPTKMRWALPEGWSAAAFEWPYPQTIPASPLMSYGYEGEATLLVTVTPPATLAPDTMVTLGGRLDWLECQEVCLPGKAPLDVELPVRAQTPALVSARQAFFADARARLPVDGASWKPRLLVKGSQAALRFEPPFGGLRAASFFPDRARVIEHSEPQKLLASGQGFSLGLLRAKDAEELAGVSGVLVVEHAAGRSAVQVEMAPQIVQELPQGQPVVAQAEALPTGGPGLLAALGLAFVGGLILNLMPCVLPVLSLKVLSFVRHAGGEPRVAARHGLAFAAGVLLSFWALAIVLLLLRAGGAQVGWGFQLQSPGFVGALTCLFFLIGLNLFGVFEVGLSLTRAGNLGVGQTGLWSSFSGGALTTIVATPCTAPFMGSALGFGLSQPAHVALAIFTALGLGMAAPYLLLSFQPALLRFLPRPGAWMESFKQLMGFFMMGTVVVLAWIFGQQAGNDALAFLLGGLVVLGLGGWLYGRAVLSTAAPGPRRLSLAVAALCAGAGLFLGLHQAKAAPRPGVQEPVFEGVIAWQSYSPEAVQAARTAGRPVFIDFTAAWCLSCQVNERVALRSAGVQQRFRDRGIVAFKADWTLYDERITEALRSFGRSGVPLYVLYAPGQAEARLLPEVITPDIVVRALDEALGH